MKKRLLVLLLVFSMVLVPLGGCGDKYTVPEGAVSILFIGNSFIYVGDVPSQMQTLAKLYGTQIVSQSICPGGAKLSDTKEKALESMKKYHYDYVVMNDYGSRPTSDPDAFYADVKELCDAAKAIGATPVLYNPAWINDGGVPDIDYQTMETAAYEKAAKTNDAMLVSAGEAWVYAYRKLSDISSLYRPGDYHASDAGAYYTTCVFLATLFDIEVKDIAEDNLYHGDDAIDLAQTAWEFVSYYKQNGGCPTEPVTVSPGANEAVG